MAHTEASLDAKGEELLAMERRFEAALLSSDVVALEEILAEGFFLNDFMGGVISRNELLQYLRSGAMKFRGIVPHDVSVQAFGVTGIVTGWTEMKAELLGVVSEVKSRFLHVYVGSPQSWRMVAGQGTVIPDR